MGRVSCKSDNYDLDFKIDINTAVYAVKEGEKLSLALTSALSEDKLDEGVYDQRRDKSTLVDEYEYVAYGKVFKYEGMIDVKISFGFFFVIISCFSKQRRATKSQLAFLLVVF